MHKPVRGWYFYFTAGLCAAGLLVFAAYVVCVTSVYRYSLPRPLRPADAALVLGAAAWDKNPSPVFRERINHAVDLYKNHTVKNIIFTGGTPKEGFMTEAAVGRRYALRQNVDGQDIVVETQSRDTYQNLLNARALADNSGIRSVIIVSDPYHLARAAAVARDLGWNAQTSPTPSTRYTSYGAKLKFMAKEAWLLLIYRLSGFVQQTAALLTHP